MTPPLCVFGLAETALVNQAPAKSAPGLGPSGFDPHAFARLGLRAPLAPGQRPLLGLYRTLQGKADSPGDATARVLDLRTTQEGEPAEFGKNRTLSASPLRLGPLRLPVRCQEMRRQRTYMERSESIRAQSASKRRGDFYRKRQFVALIYVTGKYHL